MTTEANPVDAAMSFTEVEPLPEPLFDIGVQIGTSHFQFNCRLCGASVIDPEGQHARRDAHKRWHEANRTAISTLSTLVRATLDGLQLFAAALEAEG